MTCARGNQWGRVVKRKRAHNQAHFLVTARVDKARATPARVSIDRESGLVTIGRLRARRRYRIQLATMIECAMGRIMRDDAEMRLHVGRGGGG